MPYRWLISWALIFRLYVARRIFALYSSVRSWDASSGESNLDESANASSLGFRSSSTWNTPAPCAPAMKLQDSEAIAHDYQKKYKFGAVSISGAESASVRYLNARWLNRDRS